MNTVGVHNADAQIERTTTQKNRKEANSFLYNSVGMPKINFDLEQISLDKFNKLVKQYARKSVVRLRSFLIEAKRSCNKVTTVLNKLNELGYKVVSIKIKNDDNKNLASRRKRVRQLIFDLVTERGIYKFNGQLVVRPCTIHLILNEDEKYWFNKNVLQIKFYKNLCVQDNYLNFMVNCTEKEKEKYSNYFKEV